MNNPTDTIEWWPTLHNAQVEAVAKRLARGRDEDWRIYQHLASEALWEASETVRKAGYVVVPLTRLIEELERAITHKPNDYAQEGANYAIGRIIRVLRGLT